MPWKGQKTFSILMLPGGIEMENWAKVGWEIQMFLTFLPKKVTLQQISTWMCAENWMLTARCHRR